MNGASQYADNKEGPIDGKYRLVITMAILQL